MSSVHSDGNCNRDSSNNESSDCSSLVVATVIVIAIPLNMPSYEYRLLPVGKFCYAKSIPGSHVPTTLLMSLRIWDTLCRGGPIA